MEERELTSEELKSSKLFINGKFVDLDDTEAIMQTARLNSNEDEDIEETKIMTSRVQQKKTRKSLKKTIVTAEILKVTKLKPTEYLKMKERRAE